MTQNSYESIIDVFNTDDFLLEYNEYKKLNKKKINDLNIEISNININKNYYKLNISSKNIKFRNNLSEDTISIKNINNLLNKLTKNNINNISNELLIEINKNKSIIYHIIDTIISKSISELQYIDYYITVLDKILKTNNNVNIDNIIKNKCNNIYVEYEKNKSDYLSLCSFNKNIDEFIGLSTFIIKMEINNIIKNYKCYIINKMFDNIIIDNEDILYKSIITLYNIFTLLDKNEIIKYKEKINDILNKNISKKNKFLLMDILELIN